MSGGQLLTAVLPRSGSGGPSTDSILSWFGQFPSIRFYALHPVLCMQRNSHLNKTRGTSCVSRRRQQLNSEASLLERVCVYSV